MLYHLYVLQEVEQGRADIAAGRGGSPIADGVRFGFLVGVFALGSFVLHNYVNLNIGLKLTLGQGVAYFIQWIVAGVTIALLYRPAPR